MRLRWPLVLLLGGLLSLQPEPSLCQTTFPGLHTDTLADASFCAYGNTSPWRLKLPDQPIHRLSGENAIARSYISNGALTGSQAPFWRTSGDNDHNGCTGGYYNCPGDSLMAVWVATPSDPLVTIRCDGVDTNYGCWEHDQQVCPGNTPGCSRTWTNVRVPNNMIPGLNQAETGDVNWAVVQPNGDVIEAYHCRILGPITSGMTISPSSVCNGATGSGFIGAMLLSNLNTDRGVNGAINSGPNGLAIGLKYAHVVGSNPAPNSAIWMNTSCNGSGFRYPASSSTRECQNASLGLPTGAHLWLNMSHAQIDAEIAAGTVNAAWRGILYAAKDYGIYLGDTGGGFGDITPQFALGWLENAVQLTVNGNHNPWIDWMRLTDSSIQNDSFLPTVRYNPFFPPAIRNNIEVVDECYAYPRGHTGDNCTANDDRPVLETTCPGSSGTAPTVTITAPNNGNDTTVPTSPLTNLAGNATDDVGVASVTWACQGGCSQTGGSATCTGCGVNGTPVTWTVGSIGFPNPGTYTITVTATDGGATPQTGRDQIQITYAPPATPELVAEYLFNGTLNDSSGKGNHLTFQPVGGTPSYVSTGATYGQGLNLNGTSQYVEAANSTSLTLTTGVTMAAWLKPSTSLTNSKTIVMKSFVYYLFGSIQANTICGATNLGPAVGIASPGGTLSTVCTSTALPVGQWTHLAGRLLNGVLTLFVNGNAVGTPVNAAGTIDSSTDLLYVGGNPNPTEKFPGVMEKVQVYNYGLSNSEIAALATPVPETSGVRRPRHRGFVMK